MRKIAVFTGARSEYGLLRPLLRKLESDPRFNLRILAGPNHFLEDQGNTINELLSDGFKPDAEFRSSYTGKDALFIHKSNAELTEAIAIYFDRKKPDLLVVLGDRFELLPVVSTALLFPIPVAHISGGEVTEGAVDNQIRHAVSKMSHLHFPATEKYRENLIQMGEEPWRICVSGEPGLDEVLNLTLPSRSDFFESYKLPLSKKLVLATIHSETIGQTINAEFIKTLLGRLKALTEFHFLFTAANADEGGRAVNEVLVEESNNSDNLTYVPSLGKTNYYTALKYATLVLGNSSSGVVEAQSFGVPVINIGNRQAGRLFNPNCLTVAADVETIMQSFPIATGQEFARQFQGKSNIYGDGHASERIVSFIDKVAWDELLKKKSIFK